MKTNSTIKLINEKIWDNCVSEEEFNAKHKQRVIEGKTTKLGDSKLAVTKDDVRDYEDYCADRHVADYPESFVPNFNL